MLEDKKAIQSNVLGEYYEARRKALIVLSEARRRSQAPDKNKTE